MSLSCRSIPHYHPSTISLQEGALVPSLQTPAERPDLCPRCRQINLDEAFRHFARWERPRQRLIFEFESVADLLLDPACPLCIVFSDARGFDSKLTGGFGYQLLAIHSAECVSYFDHRGDPPQGPVWLAVVPVKLGWHRRGMLPSTFWGAHIEVDFVAECRPLQPGEEAPPLCGIDPETIDFAVLRYWTEVCAAEHVATCITDQAVLPGLVVIDCKTRELEPAAPDCKYAALSYVWGPAPQSDETTAEPDRIPAAGLVPLTIEDALTVTKRLGLQYLWIDRYCIPESKKAQQIAAMDKVYEAAQVTIIAAAGSDPTYGLPGVSTRPRTPQQIIPVGTRRLVRTLVNPAQHIKAARWSTRGWTYQEGHLSLRRLVFTDAQVYFQCKAAGPEQQATVCETLDARVLKKHLRHAGPGTALYAPKPCFRENAPWHGIDEFAARTLGWPRDVLNAMLGILHKWQDGSAHFRQVGGLPVIKATNHPRESQVWETCLLQSLCWKVGQPSDRREGFPSWSWTGWAQFRGIRLDSIPNLKGRHKFPIVRAELASGLLLAGDSLGNAFEERDQALDGVRFLHTTALVLPLRIVPRKASPSGFAAPTDTLSNPDWMVEVGGCNGSDTYDFQLNLAVPGNNDKSCNHLVRAFETGFDCKGLLLAPERNKDATENKIDGLSDEESLPFPKYPKYREVIIVRDLGADKWFERIGFFEVHYSSVKKVALRVESLRFG